MTVSTPTIKLTPQPLVYVITVDSKMGPAQQFLPLANSEEHAHMIAKAEYIKVYGEGYCVHWSDMYLCGSYGPFIPVEVIGNDTD